MSTIVFIAVIGAALLHAGWNAVVKGGSDKRVGMSAIMIGHLPVALICVAVLPTPHPDSWPYLACGLLAHLGYQTFLIQSYRFGDLTQVYPIARGSAPMIVALVSVLVLGVVLAPIELVAVAIIGLGILSLALVRRADGMRNGQAALLALVTGCFIASYSLIDGYGARLAGSSVSYYSWLAIFNAAIWAGAMRAFAPGVLTEMGRSGKRAFWIGGTASFVAYALVTWAFTQAPIALVTALRETSIIFALLIGVVFLREPLNLMKVCSTMVTLCGVILLRLGRTSS